MSDRLYMVFGRHTIEIMFEYHQIVIVFLSIQYRTINKLETEQMSNYDTRSRVNLLISENIN